MRFFTCLLAFSIVFLFSCSAQSKRHSSKTKSKNGAFKLLDASAEKWISGVKGGGSGIDYYFKIVIKTSNKLRFDSLWTNHLAYSLFVTKPSGPISNAPITFSKGDTIILRASSSTSDNGTAVKSVAPINLNTSDGLIGYKLSNRQKYFSVKKITIKQSNDRP